MLEQDLLAEGFVERDRERGAIRAGVGDAEQLAEGRDLGLAVAAFDAFGDVEDQVDIGFGEDAGQVGRRLEVDDDVALAGEGVRDRDDRFGRVPLGFVVAVGRALDVVREADADRLGLADARDVELGGRGEAGAQHRGVEDGADGGVVGQADLGGGGEQRGRGRQRRQCIHLEQVDAAFGGDAEVEAGEVAQAQGAQDLVGDLAQARGDVAREVGGAAVLDLGRVDVLEAVVVDLDAVALGVALLVLELDRREEAVVVADAVDEADRDVEAFDVLLDQDAFRVRAQGGAQGRGQVARLLDDGAAERAVVDALGGALVVGFHDHREREAGAALGDVLVVADGDEDAARRIDAGALDHELGDPLVERERVRVRVRARERDAELLEQGRVERFAHAAAIALRRVEDDVRIDRFEALEEIRGGPGDFDLFDLVACGFDRLRDRVHRFRAVVLGFLLGFPNVGEPQVVSERDLHAIPALAKRCDSETVKGNQRLVEHTKRPSDTS